MLRVLLQLGILAGAAAFGLSSLDTATTKRLEEAVKGLIGGAEQPELQKQLQKDAAHANVAGQETAQQENGKTKERANTEYTPPKAFYNAPPPECPGERIIDPEDGRVRCSIMERSTARR